MNILLKNILDSCIGGICFYVLGYGFAYGHKLNEEPNLFLSAWNYALKYTSKVSTMDTSNGGATSDGFSSMGWQSFFFQWSFAATATTIVSGAVAERCTLLAYLCYSAFMSSFVYPVVVHWVWSPYGWLSVFNTSYWGGGYSLILRTGAIDFAGSGVVHMVGGWSALIGAYLLGPRIGRFGPNGQVNDLRGHNVPLIVLGTFLLWFGWYGFNPGSNLSISTRGAAVIVSRVAVTTTLSAAGGGVATLLIKFLTSRTWDIPATCNGVLAGLVGITAGCAVVEPWAAIICGFLSSVFFIGAEHLQIRVLRIDDPVSAWPLHGVAGVVGVLFPGLLATPRYCKEVYGGVGFGSDSIEGHRYGIFYGGHGQLLLAQAIEVGCIIVWSVGLMGIVFLFLRIIGQLRVSVETELQGLDQSKHGGSAYAYGDGGGGRAQGEVGKAGAIAMVPLIGAIGAGGSEAVRSSFGSGNKVVPIRSDNPSPKGEGEQSEDAKAKKTEVAPLMSEDGKSNNASLVSY
eukprot:CAMPEP_0175043048 /NCGR_PEP_ID=MMETSP0052_2-20121109/2941_1 /TAXON_ID=51329 ORGANISM="Polytomella parva, Strain SAG 63-3" /NCGR_SAMPLE_ID=MMETSP0052_2 /ASSEMBLY_ACC=CAM_ASM_000194 /LENGTH=512 /DNA_ID=CAMNT_0016306005 /DNA_START=304 /DNA_END=1842 /DNA_ORIENTATION=+